MQGLNYGPNKCNGPNLRPTVQMTNRHAKSTCVGQK
jgi:hypothetical protein